jgi:hypothetical protein
MNNMRQLGVAALNYETTHTHFPPGLGYYNEHNPSANKDFGTWLFYLLQHLEENNLFEQSRGLLDFPPPTGRKIVRYPGNNEVYGEPVSTFLCPSDPSMERYGVVTIDDVVFGATCYVPNAYGVSAKSKFIQDEDKWDTNPQAKTRFKDITDGTTHTILHAEKYAHCTNSDMDPAFQEGGGAWAYCTSPKFDWLPPPMKGPAKGFQPGFAIPVLKNRKAPNPIGPTSLFQNHPREGDCDPTRASTAHTGGMVTGFVDGRVHILAAGMTGDVWWAAVTHNEGDRPDFDW